MLAFVTVCYTNFAIIIIIIIIIIIPRQKNTGKRPEVSK